MSIKYFSSTQNMTKSETYQKQEVIIIAGWETNGKRKAKVSKKRSILLGESAHGSGSSECAHAAAGRG